MLIRLPPQIIHNAITALSSTKNSELPALTVQQHLVKTLFNAHLNDELTQHNAMKKAKEALNEVKLYDRDENLSKQMVVASAQAVNDFFNPKAQPIEQRMEASTAYADTITSLSLIDAVKSLQKIHPYITAAMGFEKLKNGLLSDNHFASNLDRTTLQQEKEKQAQQFKEVMQNPNHIIPTLLQRVMDNPQSLDVQQFIASKNNNVYSFGKILSDLPEHNMPLEDKYMAHQLALLDESQSPKSKVDTQYLPYNRQNVNLNDNNDRRLETELTKRAVMDFYKETQEYKIKPTREREDYYAPPFYLNLKSQLRQEYTHEKDIVKCIDAVIEKNQHKSVLFDSTNYYDRRQYFDTISRNELSEMCRQIDESYKNQFAAKLQQNELNQSTSPQYEYKQHRGMKP